MTELDGAVIGQMFIQLLGDASVIQQALEFLQANGVEVEQSGVQA